MVTTESKERTQHPESGDKNIIANFSILKHNYILDSYTLNDNYSLTWFIFNLKIYMTIFFFCVNNFHKTIMEHIKTILPRNKQIYGPKPHKYHNTEQINLKLKSAWGYAASDDRDNYSVL